MANDALPTEPPVPLASTTVVCRGERRRIAVRRMSLTLGFLGWVLCLTIPLLIPMPENGDHLIPLAVTLVFCGSALLLRLIDTYWPGSRKEPDSLAYTAGWMLN